MADTEITVSPLKRIDPVQLLNRWQVYSSYQEWIHRVHSSSREAWDVTATLGSDVLLFKNALTTTVDGMFKSKTDKTNLIAVRNLDKYTLWEGTVQHCIDEPTKWIVHGPDNFRRVNYENDTRGHKYITVLQRYYTKTLEVMTESQLVKLDYINSYSMNDLLDLFERYPGASISITVLSREAGTIPYRNVLINEVNVNA